jgi:antitoxin FitA
MASITLKNIPENLHERLKSSAERNRRSLNQEALVLLEAQLNTQPASGEALLGLVRETRAKHPFRTTNAEINRFKRQGRM